MLRWRLVLGVMFIGALVGLCRLDLWLGDQYDLPGLALFPLTILLAILAAGEMIGMLRSGKLDPIPWVVYLGSVSVVASGAIAFFWPNYPADCPIGKLGWPVVTLGMGVLVAFAAEMHRYEKPGRSTVNLAVALFSIVYVGLLLSFVIQLRMLGGNVIGMASLVAMVIIVKSCDIGAYTVGRIFGRHKMAPVLSPGKTIEGGCGGVLFSCVTSYLVFRFLMPHWTDQQNPSTFQIGWIIYGGMIGVVGLLGDLSESLLKRDLGQKDSSHWMPGFGGVLDLLDSVLIAAPFAYVCHVTALVKM